MPKQSKFGLGTKPSPEEIATARDRAGMTQQQAAEVVHLRTYQRWAEYERGVHAMDVARWELFLLMTNQHPTKICAERRGTNA